VYWARCRPTPPVIRAAKSAAIDAADATKLGSISAAPLRPVIEVISPDMGIH